MRIGEVRCALTLQDVDLTEQVIAIRDTKFFKTRLVPIGPRLHQELVRTYRSTPPPPSITGWGDVALIHHARWTRHGHYVRVIAWFQDVFAELQVSFALLANPGPQGASSA